MSADNWATCPKCRKIERDAFEAKLAKHKESYGKIPADEFIANAQAIEAIYPNESNLTLREDWELGTCEDGKFYVIYSSSCGVCKHSFEYKYEQMALAPEQSKPRKKP